jgi:hypothetical protein
MSSLPTPNLDDRDFEQLRADALAYIERATDGWTDLTAGDPGIVLVEVFAYLTDLLLHRLNHVPDKLFIEFLRLIGVRLEPPSAAQVDLTFSRSAGAAEISIPRGTRVTVERGAGDGAPVFVTTADASMPAGQNEAVVRAFHAEPIDAELLGRGTGVPGLTLQLARPPVVLPVGAELPLVIGVEEDPEKLDTGAPTRAHSGKTFRLWTEVSSFAERGADPHVYVVDRFAGRVTFAPAARMRVDNGPLGTVGALDDHLEALGGVPGVGREIRAWYWRGGGPDGNVSAESLTVLKTALKGAEVTNKSPSSGGRAEESLANAMIRGPQELRAPLRAVTAGDFENIATSSSGTVARAAALTRADLWSHGAPGTVELLLVPRVDGGGAPERVPVERLRAMETEEARARVAQDVTLRSPLGISSVVSWAHYKTVTVTASIAVHRPEDGAEVARRVEDRLHSVINPLRNGESLSGWPFGQTLRASHVYEIALREPGVRYVDQISFKVDEAPSKQVTSIERDASQPNTWFAGMGDQVFRTLDGADGWESVARFENEAVEVIHSHPSVPGLVAVSTRAANAEVSSLRLTRDCGESWAEGARLDYHVEDLAWMVRDGGPVLLLATDKGLFQLPVGGRPVEINVAGPAVPVYAVATVTDVRGALTIAVALQREGGVHISTDGGVSFLPAALQGEDVRHFAVQADGSRRFVWAGTAAEAGTGAGCFRWEIGSPSGWERFDRNWIGGSCHDLTVGGQRVYAGTHETGVLWLDTTAREPVWVAPSVTSKLPLREAGRYEPVYAISASPGGDLVLAGGPAGMSRSKDQGATYSMTGEDLLTDRVTLPPTWLFCSGAHQVTVV